MTKNKSLDAETVIEIIDKISLFDDLDTEEKQLLSHLGWCFSVFAKGDYLTYEDSFDKRFFILLTGGVNIVKGSQEQLLTQLKPGEIIGEISFLTNEPRSASAIANKHSTALVVDQKLMDNITIEMREKIKDQIVLKLAQRLITMNNRFALGQL